MIGVDYDVTAPVEGYTGTVAGVAFSDGRGCASASSAVQYFRRHGYTVVPAGEGQRGDAGGGVGSGSGPDSIERPARSAKKADWAQYARQADPDATDLESLTKEQLIDRYGGSDG